MKAFSNLLIWQKVLLGVMSVVVIAVSGLQVFSIIENTSLERENKKLVKQKFNELEAKEDYWKEVDKAYQDTMAMYHALQVLSGERADSIRDARKQIQILKAKQHEIVRNFNDTTRGAELDRISARHGL